MSKWNNETLVDVSTIITGPFGSQLHQADYKASGIAVIMPQNISNRTVSFENIAYINDEDAERLKRYLVKVNDMVYSRRGDVEKHAFIDDNLDGLICGTGCLRVRFNTNKVHPNFISHFLNRVESRKWLVNHAIGSNMPNLNTGILSALPISYPEDMNEQIRISKCLNLISQKIQLNNKINETLQEQAQDLYMHLFFRKAPNGKIADILLENEKSTIQVGEAKATNGEYPFFTSGKAILGWVESLVGGRNCFLNTGGNADVKFYAGDAAYSTDTWCITAKNALSDYLYLLLNSIKVELNQKFFQGTGLKHLQKELLKDRPIYIPDEKEINTFNKTICPMFDMISEKTRETQELTALRDWLLPMLMNGQATVAEEQKPISKVIENDTKNEQSGRFALWLQNQGLAARGDIDRQTLREIFDAMDDDDK